MTIVLGFDVSSSTIGWGALEIHNQDISFITCGFIKPKKKGSIIERIVSTRDEVVKVIRQTRPDHIGIEEIVQFMKGLSTAKTIIMLTTFNRMTGLAAYDYLQQLPQLFSVMTIRHGLKMGKKLPQKEEMPQLVSQHLGITFPYVYNKKGQLKKKNEDMADGIAVALYYAFKLTGRIKNKVKKRES